MPLVLKENLIWAALVPLGIAFIGAIVSVTLTRKWGTPDPFRQKMRHATRAEKIKDTIFWYDAIQRDPFDHLLFEAKLLLGGLMAFSALAAVVTLPLGIYIFLTPPENPNEVVTASTYFDITGVIFAYIGIVALNYSLIIWSSYMRLRRIRRFAKYERPKLEAELKVLETL